MQVIILAVGRMKSGPEQQQVETYLARCPWPVNIIEVEERRPLKGDVRLVKEGDLILKALMNIGRDNAYVIALDERGKTMRSTKFSQMIRTQQDNGIAKIIFLIGGADGYDARVKNEANFLMSFSDMTWPHMMVRAMLCEQLYRASCILTGHPYHKD
ncbi:MAG: 23S rRNA (pseudouridine(1915)-N(3))-methyltransferase RlmH [Emcibacter sp.]|nr:23S rRNA (pseudouridine(1915)-N(3))-methyltransferase RlmH [Emcibacter sp.]